MGTTTPANAILSTDYSFLISDLMSIWEMYEETHTAAQTLIYLPIHTVHNSDISTMTDVGL